MLSPFMFIFYLNELIHMCEIENCRGVFVDEDHSVNMLLYADDIVLVGDNIGDVQKLLNILSDFCNKWCLKVNLEKTKFMVFRNGGIVKGIEKVYFNNVKLEPVRYYKYLGLLVSSRLNWHQAHATLANQATKALNCISEFIREFYFTFEPCLEIFHKCVTPVLTYASEIWGMNVYPEIQSILVKFCRRQLGVGSKTPIPAVLGECGMVGIYVECKIKSLKYWIKILAQPHDSLLRACYTMLFQQCNAGRKNWASQMKNMLYEMGFGYIWELQEVNDRNCFINEFKARLLDCEKQMWRTSVTNMPKLELYSLFKLKAGN